VRYDIFLDNNKNLKLFEKDTYILKVNSIKTDYIIYNILPLFLNEVFDLKEFKREVLFCISFDINGLCKGLIKFDNGNKSSINPDLRRLWSFIMLSDSKDFVLVHNHPSNNALPSKADVLFNKQIDDVCKKLHINFLEHIIITKDNYYCMKKNGGKNYEWKIRK
jgi:hypothetical protein